MTRLTVASAALAANMLLISGLANAQADLDFTWTYYRPGNTGVMGDFSGALWIDPSGTLYLGGYDATFEEGGFSNFIEAENRWVNFSNVDYPVIGDPNNIASSRISDFVPDANGGLWMGTWRGALYFDPAIGPDSLVRYDASNSPMPGGRADDVSIAPDGTVWFACFGVSWGGGGLVRYTPSTDEWKVWGLNAEADGWPGRIVLESAVVQPKPGGGYLVWIEDTFGDVVYDSDTQQFTEIVDNDAPGDIQVILNKDASDDAGNVWMLRFVAPGQGFSLEYRRPDGTWVAPPQPFGLVTNISAIRAFGDGECLLLGPDNFAWQFDGTSWTNLGQWRPGLQGSAIDMDADGNVWVSGNGGAGRRDAVTGQWQRHRLTNTGQIDYFPRDISFAPSGDVWVTGNAAPGVGGIGMFDGQRWRNHNILHYGLGEDWPFPTDNANAITFRPSTGSVAFNPMFSGIREWDGTSYTTHEEFTSSKGMVEDSLGRLWTIDFNLRYHGGSGFVTVPINSIQGKSIDKDPDRPGTVWACSGNVILRTDGDYRFSQEVADIPELNSLHDIFIGAVAAPNGIAWVGTTDGLIRLDANTGVHDWFHPSNSAVVGDIILPLAVAPDGKVWYTNHGSQGVEWSLAWFDGTNGGTITQAQGLPHSQIDDGELREVEGGYELWLATMSRGIGVLTVTMPCLADVNGDGQVTPTDFTAWINAFNNNLPECDQNGDGACTPTDFTAWIANFNAGCN